MQARFLPHAAVAVACQTLFALAISVFAMGQTASLSTNTLSFGNQPLGTTSAVQSVTVTNTGSATLTFSGIGVYGVEAADWAPLSNTCSGGLKPGHSCSVSAKFTPQAAGARSATIKITDNAPNSPQQVALTGTGVAAVVSFSVPNLSFAVQTVGFSSSPQPVTLTNSGTANLTISSIVSKGDYTQSNNCPSSIAPNGSCTINVTFTPEVAWARMGTIIVTGNVIAPPLFLSGMGSSGGSVSSSAQSLAFASQVVGSASTPQLVTLTNIGSAAVTISGISVSGDYTESNDCDGLLSLGANCQINVTFTPT
ncbi:MAG: choice-of-anchor D domain-containing protein, partial [Candidatus Sulfotelmatobacter sp.]